MELWKDIEGYEGFYQISDMGRVKSLTRRVKGKVSHKDGQKMIYEKILKANPKSPKSYRCVAICREGVRYTAKIARLVAIHFVDGRTKERCHVNHIDGNKLNDVCTNLEWCTPSENTRHAYAMELIPKLPRWAVI